MRLRVKDMVLGRKNLVRDGKGFKDRLTMLPAALVRPLIIICSASRRCISKIFADGHGEVYLPFALEKSIPNAAREWAWQYVFASQHAAGRSAHRAKCGRHHLRNRRCSARSSRPRVDAKFVKPGHAAYAAPFLRHAFARGGYDIRTVQELFGHADVSTTMIYTHVLNRGGRGVVSPMDSL